MQQTHEAERKWLGEGDFPIGYLFKVTGKKRAQTQMTSIIDDQGVEHTHLSEV